VALPPSPELPEFIFGALSTEEGRLREARRARSGLEHPVRRLVLAPEAGEAVPMTRTRLEWDTLAWGYLEEWSATIPGQPAGTAVFHALHAATVTGATVGCPWSGSLSSKSRLDSALPRTYAYVAGRRPIPDWIREVVIYQVFIDRFAPEPGGAFQQPDDLAGRFGGSLRGLIHRLDHLRDLGITCLWLTPLFPSPSHHGYDPIDLGAVEPRLGTLEDWDALVAATRQRGMRLLLDDVVNHVSSAHPRFLAAQADPADPAAAWFRFRSHPHDDDCFFDVPGQPELQTDHPEVRAYFLEHARFWLRRGCDGFRLDYAANVSHAFWSLPIPPRSPGLSGASGHRSSRRDRAPAGAPAHAPWHPP